MDKDVTNALKILNEDYNLMIKLIKEKYQSKIFGSIGEHLVFLRRLDTLKDISEILNQRSNQNEIQTDQFVLSDQNSEVFICENQDAHDFISSFLSLARELNYQEILLYFDGNSIRTPVLSGLLKKYTNVLNQFKTRYVVLYDDYFAYFKIKNGKKILRNKIRFNMITKIELKKKKLYISTFSDKIILRAKADEITKWYEKLKSTINIINDKQKYVFNYLFRILFYQSNEEQKNELLKLKHSEIYLKELHTQQDEIIEVKEEQSKPTEKDIFYDFEDKTVEDKSMIRKYFEYLFENKYEIPFCASLFDPYSMLQRIGEIPIQFAEVYEQISNECTHPVLIVTIFILKMLQMEKKRKFMLTFIEKETFVFGYLDLEIFVENIKNKIYLHASDEKLKIHGEFHFKLLSKDEALVVKNKSKIHFEFDNHKVTVLTPDLIIDEEIHFRHGFTVCYKGVSYHIKLHGEKVSFEFEVEEDAYEATGSLLNINFMKNGAKMELFDSVDLRTYNLNSNRNLKSKMVTDSRTRPDIRSICKYNQKKVPEIDSRYDQQFECTDTSFQYFCSENGIIRLKDNIDWEFIEVGIDDTYDLSE